jgi:3'-phosphoadenosine 5'-phosphosulfate sulfotransferase (PAPS reductase)/FAD synthetase
MYKITWDKETGGVLLHTRVVDDTLGVSPRPVFYEELDLLGLDNLGWKYPRCKEPLLWAINKQYWYRGELMFEAKGANIYDAATIVFQEGCEKKQLTPVNMKKMLERNREIMFVIESEAIEFIRDTYTTYAQAKKSVEKVKANQLDYEALAARMEQKTKRKMAIVKEDCDSFEVMPLDIANEQGRRVFQTTKIDRFIASFSGGKDSQVVLDLCTRAIPSTDFEVLYSDTGYELPPSLSLYEEIQEYYKKKFPDLKFTLTKNHESVLNYWDKIGTPSDKHRWCCAVMKTAPLYRALKIEGTNKQAKVLAFEGVRAEESAKRSGYNRIGKGVKHSFVVNARPILLWNTTEIFLYLFRYDLPINDAYRVGKPRVGCVFCPFSSPWDDMIVSRRYQANLDPFLNRVITWSKQRKIPNLDEYVKDRRWRLRASGNDMKDKTQIAFNQSYPKFVAKVINANYTFETWLPVLGDFTLSANKNSYKGEIKYKKEIYPFEIISTDEKNFTLTVHNASDIYFIKHLKRIVLKCAYCINCEVCEVECPTGALSVYPKIEINKSKCIHCHKCLDFHDHGCLVADSLVTNMDNKVKTGSISKYGTFGIHEEWIDEFLANPDVFWEINALGKKQVDSFKAWLKDAEFIDAKNQLTELGQFCSDNYANERELVWEIIWINLCSNSTLTNWFINTINPGQLFDKKLLDEYASDRFAGEFTTKTISYAITGFLQLFKYSPLGLELQQGELDIDGAFKRNSYLELSEAGFAYSLYKYGNAKGIKSLRVTDFYEDECEGGPAKEFCLTKSSMEKILRSLNSSASRVLIADLNMGLDNISLTKESTALEVVKQIICVV